MVRHEAALAELFGEVLGLCDQAGLVKPGLIAIDGTRVAGNASRETNREFEQIAREILAEAKAIDAAEDELYGQARGDELPEQLRSAEGRRGFFGEAKRKREGREPDARRAGVRGAGSGGRRVRVRCGADRRPRPGPRGLVARR